MENEKSPIQFGSATTIDRTVSVVLLSSLFIDLVVGTVGTVGNSRAVGEFSKRCGSGGKT
jgi:hypothetical protein